MKYITNIYRKEFNYKVTEDYSYYVPPKKIVQKNNVIKKKLIEADKIDFQAIANKCAAKINMSNIDCEICCEEVTSYIECGICLIKVCYVCFLRTLYENPTDIRCINKGSCSYTYQDKHLNEIFKKSFFEKDFRDILTLKYYEQEISNIDNIARIIAEEEDFLRVFGKCNKAIDFFCTLNGVENDNTIIPDITIHCELLRDLINTLPKIDSCVEFIPISVNSIESPIEILVSTEYPEDVMFKSMTFIQKLRHNHERILFYCLFIIANFTVFTDKLIEYLNIDYIRHGMKLLYDDFFNANRMCRIYGHIKKYSDTVLKFRKSYEKHHSYSSSTDIFNENYKKDTNKFKVEDVKTYGRCLLSECNGVLVRMKCTACTKVFCAKCHEVRKEGERHECKESDILSVKEIEKNTKRCPSCAGHIFKISGCSHMWCTNCNTAFNWNTMQIYKNLERFHNPEHDRYLQENPNNRVEGACGNQYIWVNIINNDIFIKAIQKNISKGKFIKINEHDINTNNKILLIISFISESYRISTELDQNILDHNTLINSFNKYAKKYRIDFVKKIINKDEFSRKIFLMRRRLKMKNDINNICQNYGNLISDICIQFSNESIRQDNINSPSYIENLQQIIDYLMTMIKEFTMIIQSFGQPNLKFTYEIRNNKFEMRFTDATINTFNI